MIQKIENAISYVYATAYLLLGLFLSYCYFKKLLVIPVADPSYQMVCYVTSILMLPQLPINFFFRLFIFGVGLVILESGVE